MPHRGVYGSRVTVHVAIPITFFKDDKTGKYSYEYGEIYPKSLEIEGVTVGFDLESETARE